MENTIVEYEPLDHKHNIKTLISKTMKWNRVKTYRIVYIILLHTPPLGKRQNPLIGRYTENFEPFRDRWVSRSPMIFSISSFNPQNPTASVSAFISFRLIPYSLVIYKSKSNIL